MKVIDLLNKIAKGEIPEIIKYDNMIWKYDDYYFNDCSFSLDDYCNLLNSLNDEVEIIEDTPKEDKKIEHINKVYDLTDFRKDYPVVAEMLKDLSNKQYEIINRLNGEDNE